MPRHKSAVKRVRQSAKRQARNRMHRSRMRSMIKQLESMEDKEEAAEFLPEVKAKIDRLTSKGLLHENKAARYKSRLEKHVNALEA
ncbi:MAG: 30S ribosomal protein S20 [Bacteroidetes bacterium]|jgi:small subunit ribosomal protein S20|nr:30S ribosomal protein S20 [Bacteroidota bacterium]